MNEKNYNFLPLSLPFFIILFLLLLLLLPVLFFVYTGGIIAVLHKLGFSPFIGYLLLFLSLFGSVINIPVKKIKSSSPLTSEKEITFFGMHYNVPVIQSQETVIAINLGGAIIPILVSLYEILRLLFLGKMWLFFASLIAILIITVICHSFARPVKGIGIAIPIFIPPLATAAVSLILAWHNPSIVAYIGGTLGTLIGADLINLKRITGLGAPVASIGGAGTFDGIFLTGILAVLLV